MTSAWCFGVLHIQKLPKATKHLYLVIRDIALLTYVHVYLEVNVHYLLGFQSLSTVIDKHFVGILDLRLTLRKPFTLIELLHNIIIGEKAKVEPSQEF